MSAADHHDDDIAARVRASRAAQGLPPQIEDPAAIERVAAVLGPVGAIQQAVALRPDLPVGITPEHADGVAGDGT